MFGVAVIARDSAESFGFPAQAIFVAYHNTELDVKASVTRMPTQQDFFNMRPILIKAREFALDACSKYIGSSAPVDGWVKAGYKNPEWLVKISQDGKSLMSQYVNSCVILAMSEPKVGYIKPVFIFIGVDGYSEWATLYTALDKFLQDYDTRLAKLDIELNNEGARSETVSDDIVL